MPHRSSEFHFREFDALRNEILESITETRLLERYALIATGAIWTWAATHPQVLSFQVILWLPSFIVLLAALRSLSVFARIERIGLYIAQLEDALRINRSLGWEHFLRRERKPYIFMTATAFWLFLLATNAIAAVWLSSAPETINLAIGAPNR